MRKILAPLALAGLLASCSTVTKLEGYAATASADVQAACTDFNTVMANPLAKTALAAGEAIGGPSVSAVASLVQYGTAFCASGPPAGDTTTTAQQSSWLENIVAGIKTAVGIK